ncbi:uncharacterized protein NDAI_0A05140 [Naumovozyma dairenensis CBS 421]|uniref:Altered inheritance of mitochondria protein 3 n=1 Tax=Naumovozyma dairenensis (strain ATCC 10597 / BCRC 20456 / CBS 421 / NBRC 0211 / NRRL Y-12639) TaxID=1071378 RepID=G0W4D1_NAUDC|nr:hypothetical protein NDAI_0A05140 [Naumovozyma dairenensis CBS 421]CCD22669.1 hypothetical protein NDAI_0A05140 [Naumovozyma dairenensis CBS 421]
MDSLKSGLKSAGKFGYQGTKSLAHSAKKASHKKHDNKRDSAEFERRYEHSHPHQSLSPTSSTLPNAASFPPPPLQREQMDSRHYTNTTMNPQAQNYYSRSTNIPQMGTSPQSVSPSQYSQNMYVNDNQQQLTNGNTNFQPQGQTLGHQYPTTTPQPPPQPNRQYINQSVYPPQSLGPSPQQQYAPNNQYIQPYQQSNTQQSPLPIQNGYTYNTPVLSNQANPSPQVFQQPIQQQPMQQQPMQQQPMQQQPMQQQPMQQQPMQQQPPQPLNSDVNQQFPNIPQATPNYPHELTSPLTQQNYQPSPINISNLPPPPVHKERASKISTTQQSLDSIPPSTINDNTESIEPTLKDPVHLTPQVNSNGITNDNVNNIPVQAAQPLPTNTSPYTVSSSGANTTNLYQEPTSNPISNNNSVNSYYQGTRPNPIMRNSAMNGDYTVTQSNSNSSNSYYQGTMPTLSTPPNPMAAQENIRNNTITNNGTYDTSNETSYINQSQMSEVSDIPQQSQNTEKMQPGMGVGDILNQIQSVHLKKTTPPANFATNEKKSNNTKKHIPPKIPLKKTYLRSSNDNSKSPPQIPKKKPVLNKINVHNTD